MSVALWLLAVQGAIGAFDTIYYHEYRARLPARWRETHAELKLHAVRDFLYALLFGTLPWFAWQGLLVFLLCAILVSEICLTLADFVVEKEVRKSLGDVFAGERVTHAVMGIIYGAMAANLLPTLADSWSQPTGLVFAPAAVPGWLRVWLTLAGVGVFASGLRDLYASFGLRGGGWPWPGEGAEP